MNFNNSYMQDCQFLQKLTLEMTNYFANKQDHVMKEKQINILHHHSLLSEDMSWNHGEPFEVQTTADVPPAR